MKRKENIQLSLEVAYKFEIYCPTKINEVKIKLCWNQLPRLAVQYMEMKLHIKCGWQLLLDSYGVHFNGESGSSCLF